MYGAFYMFLSSGRRYFYNPVHQGVADDVRGIGVAHDVRGLPTSNNPLLRNVCSCCNVSKRPLDMQRKVLLLVRGTTFEAMQNVLHPKGSF